MAITIKLGATASRRLDWQSILYQGDIQTVRITDPTGRHPDRPHYRSQRHGRVD